MGLKAAIVPVTPFQQNCSCWWDEAGRGRAWSIPAAMWSRSCDAIERAEASSVGSILLTHGHLDHAGGAAALQEALPD